MNVIREQSRDTSLQFIGEKEKVAWLPFHIAEVSFF